MTFTDDINRAAKRIGSRGALGKATRAIIVHFVNELVLMTPVDTGMARSNWFFGEKPNRGHSEAHDKQGTPSLKRMGDFVANVKMGSTFYISNNLPYIMRLEFDGWSKQAPAGMARITCARWNNICKEAVRSSR